MITKNSKEVAQAFQWIYDNTPLTYPKTLTIEDKKEFYGDTMKPMEKHDVMIQRGDPSQHQSQGIVERFNRMLADKLFSTTKNWKILRRVTGNGFLGCRV